MKLSSLKQTKGFTLVEILIVVIIVGLLAGIAVSKLGDSKERAVIAVKKSAAAELNKAIQATYVKGNIIPSATVQGFAGSAVLLASNSIIAAEFTTSSLDELKANLVNATPNTGSVALNGASTHRDLEVVYTAP